MEAVAENLIETMTLRVAVGAPPWAVRTADLRLAFGGHHVLDGLDLTLQAGEAILLRGENGSGKTTLLNVLSGLIRPDAGSILMRLKGRDIDVTCTSPERIARSGLGRLWQDIRLFPTMTALDNVLAASAELLDRTAFSGIVFWPLVRRQERAARERALHNLELVGMADRADSSADMLSVGQMKRVAIARLLQAEADFWLLDEPLAGLDQVSAEGLLKLIERLNVDHGKTMLVVEHQYERMAPICSRTWFLVDGHLHAEKIA
ncbi:MAG: ATP-binding cassette domain-containing protein [Pseudomonadota bacterium]